jgi:hypothetical protein
LQSSYRTELEAVAASTSYPSADSQDQTPKNDIYKIEYTETI